MTTVTFDTLELAGRLKAAGFAPEQAEAVVRVVVEAQTSMVTPDYLDASLSENKVDLIKWIAGMLLAQAGLVAALVKLF
ncbi:DUF1640 domain-containing protein [Methylobacter sp.]|uniref:DUF1640 domain-containing protein n=1 Tax=Methylobacter sp. TaxID=2051955 RepID=UPI002489457F|nr:DUF1640 domain-containing protein [Methylobacter sp.]MDI1277089.1 DUF1640 domain-containing protein [Methylobacter sp.]MDI1359646.1 DUF1640 domain-containing protein [Methylobacter sp.]